MHLWNTGDFARLADLFTPDYVRHDVYSTKSLHGVNALQEYMRGLRDALTGFKLTFHEQAEASGQVWIRWTFAGAHTGPLIGIPATGKKVEVNGITISRLRDGKVAEERVYWDRLGLMQQLEQSAVPAAR